MSNTSSAAAVELVRKTKDENPPEQSIVTLSGQMLIRRLMLNIFQPWAQITWQGSID